MSINVCLTTNMGAPITEPWLDPGGVLPRVLERAPRDSYCLQFIDPYGDTIFNRLQVSTLIAEFEALRADILDPELHAHVGSVIAYIQMVRGLVSQYVRFVGD